MALPDDSPLGRLAATFARDGRLEWIGLRPARRAPPLAVPEALLLAGRGIAGDRKAERSGGRRQVTLVQAEHLAVVGALLGVPVIDPGLLRRNLVVAGINLAALRDRPFAIGEALLQGTGACHPCSRLEEALGAGGYTTMRGHGGITAIVLEGGRVRLGDPVRAMPLSPESGGRR